MEIRYTVKSRKFENAVPWTITVRLSPWTDAT